MPELGLPLNLGFTRNNRNSKPRKARSNTVPPETLPETDPTLSNLNSLIDIQFKPMFTEMYERGRGDYAAFASDFLNISLHPGQIRWLHTYPFANERHLSSGNRFGKALQNDEPILTPTGWKPIGEAMVNDWVYSQDGTPTQIIGVYPQGVVHCYNLTFDDGSSVITSDDHLWTVRTSRERFRKDYGGKNGYRKPNEQYGKWTTLTTKQILDKWGAAPRPKQRVSIPVVDPIRFPHQDLPIDPYVFGLFLGDGGITHNRISFTTIDQELLDAVNNELVDDYRLLQSTSNKASYLLGRPIKKESRPGVQNEPNLYVDTMRHYDLMGKRSWEKHIPHEYLFNDVESRIALLQGLMDTDGTIQSGSANVEYSTTSEELAESVLFLAESLGGKGKIASRYTHFTSKGIKKQGRKSYRVDFRIPGICPFRLQRKASRWKEKSYTKERILVRIEDAGYQAATCIEVDHPSSLFVAKDFIVTHNSFSGAVKILHDVFYQTRAPKYAEMTRDYVAVNLSLTIDMARIITDYILRFSLDSKMFRQFVLEQEIKTAPFPVIPIGTPKSQRVNAFRSEIWARSSAKDARYLLGQKFDLVNYDECARDPHGEKILDEVLRMRLTDRDGRLDMTSTAAGRNWFFKAYERGGDVEGGYQLNPDDPHHIYYWSMTGTSYDNPHINHRRVRQNESVMSEVWKRQNIYGGFSDYANVFLREQINAMYEGVEYPFCTDYRKMEELNVPPDAKYLIGLDWALKRDETVLTVARVDEEGKKLNEGDNFNQSFPIVFMQGNSNYSDGGRWSWHQLISIVTQIHKRFNDARVMVDTTGTAGEAILQSLESNGCSNVVGYDFAGNNGQQKDNLIYVAQQALQNKTFKFPYNPVTANLVDQLLMYDRNDKLLKTDYVFSFCLLCENLRQANLPESQLLSLPFFYGFGSRRLGGLSVDQPYSISLPGASGARPNPFTDDILITSGGYKQVDA